MESNDLWFVTRWLDQMALGDSEKKTMKRRIRKVKISRESDHSHHLLKIATKLLVSNCLQCLKFVFSKGWPTVSNGSRFVFE